MATTTNNFLSNFNLKDSKCCGKIYMLENAQLIYHCQLCRQSNFYDIFEGLFQHYVDAHKYKPKFCVSSMAAVKEESEYEITYNEIQDDGEEQSESDSLAPVSQEDIAEDDASVNSPMSSLKKQIKEETSSSVLLEVEIFGGSLILSELEDDEDVITEQISSEQNLVHYTAEQSVDAEEACNEETHFEQQQPTRSELVKNEEGSKSQREELSHDSEEECGEDNTAVNKALEDVNIFACPICGRHYETQAKMNKHIGYHKKMQKNSNFPCEICGRSFNNKPNLTQHIQRHKGEKNVQCPECPRKFYMPKELRAHMIFHRGIKSFMCAICGKTYFTRETLKDHMRRHTNERKYQCDQCDKRFFNCKLLREHEKTHSDVRAYKCDQCDATYKKAGALWVHKQKHANLREHVCQVCSRAFNLKRQLLVHLKNVHKHK